MNFLKKATSFVSKALPVAALAAFSTGSHAAIDVTEVVTEAGLYPALIGSIGVAVLIVALAVKGIKWARSAL